ncbi:MAG: lipoprotein-releasing ABC transporter permease subunit [Pseudomonadota bacterium]
MRSQKYFELFLALRTLRGTHKNRFVSFIGGIAVAGVALGVAALIVVLSVMNGFHRELRQRLLGVASHIEIQSTPQVRVPTNAKWIDTISQHKEVAGIAPFVEGQAMLVASQHVKGVAIRGINPERETNVSDLDKHIKTGNWKDLKPGEFGIILGSELAYALQTRVGDHVMVVTPQPQFSLAGWLPRLRDCKVVGVFEMGMFEVDSSLALVHVNDAQALYQYAPEELSGWRIKLIDLWKAPQLTEEFGHFLPNFNIRDWTMMHANFFRAIQIEKRMMFIILSLMVMVAAFNIVSNQVMVVTDKRSEIAILRTLGATPRSILLIFMLNGLMMGTAGVLLGTLGGVVLALNVGHVVTFIEKLLGIHFLEKSVYYIDTLPSQVLTGDVVGIVGVALLLTFLATLYPSWTASKIQPAEALRYE